MRIIYFVVYCFIFSIVASGPIKERKTVVEDDDDLRELADWAS